MADTEKHALTRKQEAALLALVQQPTIGDAARQANIGERTIYRWLNDATFAHAYNKIRRILFHQAIGRLQQYATLAVETLAQLLSGDDTPHHVKVSSAIAILRFGKEGLELDDLARRVDELEEALSSRRYSP